MALEQLNAFLADRPVDVGPTETIGPDEFPLPAASELREEHEQISRILEKPFVAAGAYGDPPKALLQEFTRGDAAQRTRLYLALLERCFAAEAGLSTAERYRTSVFFAYGHSRAALAQLLDSGIDRGTVLLPTLRWLATRHHLYSEMALCEVVVRQVLERAEGGVLPEPFRTPLLELRANLVDGEGYGDAQNHQRRLAARIDEAFGFGIWHVLLPGEAWVDRATTDIEAMPEAQREAWIALLGHCQIAKSARPTARWSKKASDLLEAISDEAFRARVLDWFALVDRPRSRPRLKDVFLGTDERQRMHTLNGNTLRGLLWLCPPRATPELARAISRVALSSYRKVAGLGPRAVKVGNAAVQALGAIPGLDAVGQLALLKVRVKFGTAQKGIARSLAAAAEREGMAPDELEEMAVPAYGLEEVGVRREPLGETTAELRVAGAKVELGWIKPDGKRLKSPPATLREKFAEELKELEQAVKDIQNMIPAQAARIERCYLDRKTWPFDVWRERYLDHPLVGTLARRLIWSFRRDDHTESAIWSDGFVGPDSKPRPGVGPGTEVSLWHPLNEPDRDAIAAWRGWLEANRVKQPFKQAHREVYLLTDAERATGTYSNRFAGHILKQHQFNALAAARGWKNRLRLLVDDEYPPAHVELPAWGLRAEFWIEGIGDDYGADTTESGAFLHLATDQVRFYGENAAPSSAHAGGGGYRSAGTDRPENHPVALEAVPALAFSEAMRDVDLFVGVASVGNDPTWSDGGPEGRFIDYWQDYSFGALGETALTRKAVLEELIPKLEIAERCRFDGRFLVVRGDVRTYRIHLGSSNVLMEPNDEYLCIVPKQSVHREADDVFLPFEGDRTLSIILSKAMLLAEDRKIEDRVILAQIGR